jgi:hypothetical protein
MERGRVLEDGRHEKRATDASEIQKCLGMIALLIMGTGRETSKPPSFAQSSSGLAGIQRTKVIKKGPERNTVYSSIRRQLNPNTEDGSRGIGSH